MAEDRNRQNEDMENPEAGRAANEDLVGREGAEGEDEFEDADDTEEDDEDADEEPEA